MTTSIAILGTRGIPASYGGFETFAEEVATRLVRQGVDVAVYCEKRDGDVPTEYKGVRLIHVAAPRLGPLTTILFDLFCLWHARKAFDVVYMLGYGTSIFCFIPRLWGSKVWINMDGVEWARSKWGGVARLWFKVMESLAMWTPNRIIADAQGILSHLQSRHPHLPPVNVISYGAPIIDTPPDGSLLDEWCLDPGKYYLVVCRMEPENSVREIIKGYLQSETVRPLIVVGGIDLARTYILDLLEMYDSRIRFIGSVYDKQKLQALRYHAFAYFHGHTVGGTNPSLLEAMGCGNIIMASDNVFNREVAGDVALYFNEDKDVTRCISEVESYPVSHLHHLKLMARERITSAYNWEAVSDCYLRLLASVKNVIPEQQTVSFGKAAKHASDHT